MTAEGAIDVVWTAPDAFVTSIRYSPQLPAEEPSGQHGGTLHAQSPWRLTYRFLVDTSFPVRRSENLKPPRWSRLQSSTMRSTPSTMQRRLESARFSSDRAPRLLSSSLVWCRSMVCANNFLTFLIRQYDLMTVLMHHDQNPLSCRYIICEDLTRSLISFLIYNV